MRIAYVGLHLEENYIRGGIGRKIAEQVGLWKARGHSACFFLLTPDRFDLPESQVFPFGSKIPIQALRFPARELARSVELGHLIAAVRRYQPDLIYLRYGMFAVPLSKLYDVAPVVVELNTHDVYEYRYRGNLYYNLNRWTRGFTLQPASGLACVSHEIAALPDNLRYARPTTVVSNGINLSQYEPLPAPGNLRPRLAFIGSPGFTWHGVDKLRRLAQICPGMDIDIVGYQTSNLPVDLPENLHCYGFLPREEVAAHMRRADAACGTLALHRNQMEEASTLKVREYMAFGIPVILPYSDTDLSGKGFDFVLEIPNREDNIETHAGQILEFTTRMRGQRADREQVAPLIDQRVKEEQRLGFFQQILSGLGRSASAG
jgi:glycosyltransferase involved in cell wall biosynthesis